MTAALLLVTVVAWPDTGGWSQLPPLPDPLGVAGPFAGVSGGALLVGGGANFPGKPPWEGGTKVWTDRVYALERPDGRWQHAGRLPRPLAYGVSVTHGGHLVCVGGSDAIRHYADGFRLAWGEGRLVESPMPPLPRPLANACGALVGDALYVAGGTESPEADHTTRAVYRVDLAARSLRWEAVAPWPGPGRMLAAAGSAGGSFWVVGGVDLTREKGKVVRRYLRDAYRYTPGGGWTRLPDLPHPVAAAPTPAPERGGSPLLLGGDDGTQVGTPPAAHPGFNRTVLRYDAELRSWAAAGAVPAARVTVPLAGWRGLWVVPSGEARPGVRSPQVWALDPGRGE